MISSNNSSFPACSQVTATGIEGENPLLNVYFQKMLCALQIPVQASNRNTFLGAGIPFLTPSLILTRLWKQNPQQLYQPIAKPHHSRALNLMCTRNVEAFLEKTDIAYHPNWRKSGKFWRYAIAVFSKNASTLRVYGTVHVLESINIQNQTTLRSSDWSKHLQRPGARFFSGTDCGN